MKRIRKSPLNEYYGQGFTGPSGSSSSSTLGSQPYCEYRILPLTHSLEQKGNSTKTNLHEFPIRVGDAVYGKCLYDGKIHTGKISRFYYEEGSTLIKYVYIIDQNAELVPLYPSTVKKKLMYNETDSTASTSYDWQTQDAMNTPFSA